MCGIYGFTKYKNKLSSLLKIMGDVQIHRGPDSEGIYENNNISLGMRRLSIIDIAHGQQPFLSDNKNIVVFCNGEIYNYKELKQELEKDNIKFYTNSDVEVLPHLYKKYGIAFLNKLNGMFGMSIYDIEKNKLFIARDRIGVKPLYYYSKDNKFIFSSEIKSILVHQIDKELDFDALSSYIDLMFAPSPYTPFKYIKKVESGCYIEIQDNKVINNKSYEISYENYSNDYKKVVKELLDNSTELQIQADVDVGTFLSGGVDSTATSVFASQKIQHKDFYAFHMHWDNASEKIDESLYAQRVAKQYNMDYIEKKIDSKNIFGQLRKLILHLEEPMSDAAFMPTFAISDIASKKIKVILSGAGGDELFGGYPRYKEKKILKEIVKFLLYGKKLSNSYYDIYKDFNEKEWSKLFKWYKKDNTIREEIDSKFKKESKENYVQALMNFDIKYYLQDDILLLTDKMSMATSIEARVPLLDYRLVDYSKKIPLTDKINNGEYKLILKEIMEEYVEKDILYREKEGFGAPIQTWINENRDIFDGYLKDSILIQESLINEKEFYILLKKNTFTHKESWIYWKILVLEIWMKEFYVN